MKRRMLLEGALGAAASLALPLQAREAEHCEILIIGSGAAGLFAAVASRESGAKRVILVEKNPSPFFSATSYSAGSVNASGTIAQVRHGIQDFHGLEEFEEELMREGNRQNDPALVRNYVLHAAEALDWLTEKGVELTPFENVAFRMKRMHGCDRATGARYVEVLFAEAIRLGVEIWFGAKAQRLVTDGAGAVLGAEIAAQRKNRKVFASKGVILCTGGFAGDLRRVDREIPKFAGAPTFASPSSRGEGLDMARAIGAASHLIDYAGAYAYGFSLDRETRRGLIFRGHVMNLYGSITLSRFGERFTNDDQNSTKVAQILADAGETVVYQLATEAQLNDFMAKDPIQVIGWDRTKFLQETRSGSHFIHKADTLPEAASLMSLSVETLGRTISRYNRMVRDGRDADFGRRHMKGTFEHGPYFVFRTTPIVGITVGGLRVNAAMQVISDRGEAIAGLYAAGEVVGGLHGTSYIGGSSLGGALTLGRLVGQKLGAL